MDNRRRRVVLALLSVALVGCAAAEAPLSWASSPLPADDCRGETMGPVRLLVDPAEPDGALILVDDGGRSVDAVWDRSIDVSRQDGVVVLRQGARTVNGDRFTLVGSRLPGSRFLVCRVQPAS